MTTPLDKLSAIITARTPGKWEEETITSYFPNGEVRDKCAIGPVVELIGQAEADAALIATMGTLADEILAVLKAAKAMFRIDPVEGHVTDICKSAYLKDALTALETRIEELP